MKSHSSGRVFALALIASIGALGSSVRGHAEEVVLKPVAAAPTGGVPAWNIAGKDLQPDPAIVFGTLPNGMRYAINRHDNPKGGASLRFAVRVGSKDEADDQHGAAHFVEHMAFNGSKNIPEGQLLPMLERLGLAFGADTNAETDLGHTIYKLDLPNTGTETVDAGLKMMREVAGNLTFAPGAVERERGVLLSEASLRNDQARRRTAHLLAASLPGNRIGDRIEASPDRIRTITAAELRGFYEAFYRPDRATLAIVGDVDPAELERKLTKLFADWKPVGAAGTEYRGPVAEGPSDRVAAFSDPAVPELISFERNRVRPDPLNSEGERREQTLEAFAGSIIANRFWPISQQVDSPALGALFMPMEYGRNFKAYSFFVVAREGKWQEALAIGEQELRRAAIHGFTQAEVDEVKKDTLSTYNGYAEQAASRKNASIADVLVTASLDNTVVSSPAFDLAAYRRIEDEITPSSVTATFRKLWEGGPSLVHLSTKAPLADSGTAIAQAMSRSRAIAVLPPVDKPVGAFAYESFGPAGKIAADTTDRTLGIRRIRFANGTQLNLKRTRWDAGQVALRMEVGPGVQAFPTDKPGIDLMAAMMMPQDGLKAHDVVELRKILAGRQFSLDVIPQSDALVTSTLTSTTELELQLQLFAARLSATGFRPETKSQWEPVAKILGDAFAAQPGQLLQLVRGNVLTGGDGRFGLSGPTGMSALSFEELQAALKPQLAKGAVAVSLVGDFDMDAAIAAASRTLGALPKRPERKLEKYAFTPVTFRGGGLVELTHKGQPDQGVISLAWPTGDARDHRASLTRELLAAAMALRAIDLVREQLGTSYSPEARSDDQLTYPGFGYLSLTAEAGPRDMARVSEAFRKIAAEFRDKPIDTDLLKRAREPILAAETRADRNNAKWAEYAVAAQSWPETLSRWRNRAKELEAVTPADVQAAAQRWLDDSKAVEIRVKSAPPAG